MLSIFVLTIQLHMPMDAGTVLDRTSTYTYTGVAAQERCEADRQANLRTKPQSGDTISVSSCYKKS